MFHAMYSLTFNLNLPKLFALCLQTTSSFFSNWQSIYGVKDYDLTDLPWTKQSMMARQRLYAA